MRSKSASRGRVKPIFTTKRALFFCPRAQFAEGASAFADDLKRMHHAFRIAGIYLCSIDGIEPLQLRKQRRQSFALQAIIHFTAHLFRNSGQRVDAVTERIDIQHASAGGHQHIVRGEVSRAHGHRFFFEARRAVIVRQAQDPHKVVGHTCQLLSGGRGRADGEIAVELSRVGIDNGTTQKLSHAQAEFCFSHGRGADEHKKCGACSCHSVVRRNRHPKFRSRRNLFRRRCTIRYRNLP